MSSPVTQEASEASVALQEHAETPETAQRPRVAPRRYPVRRRRAPMRLVVTIDSDDENPRYMEERIEISHDMFEGEAEEDCETLESVDDDDEEEEEGSDEEMDDGFVVRDEADEIDEDFVPSDSETDEEEYASDDEMIEEDDVEVESDSEDDSDDDDGKYVIRGSVMTFNM